MICKNFYKSLAKDQEKFLSPCETELVKLFVCFVFISVFKWDRKWEIQNPKGHTTVKSVLFFGPGIYYFLPG